MNLNQMSYQERADYYNNNREPMTYSQVKTIVLALRSEKFSHARFDPRFGGLTHIYHRNPQSPTGVYHSATGPSMFVDKMIRRYRNTSPLSPTER